MTTLRIVRYLPLSFLVVAICASTARGAENLTGPADSRSLLVGDLGRPEALVFEGNKTFTREQILRGLSWHLDFHLASHRAAPLTDYSSLLQRLITTGYHRAGFPDITVKTTTDTSEHRIVIQVKEGLRFDCGDILLSGVKGMTNDVVRQKIADTLTGFEPTPRGRTGLDSNLWRPGKPAPLDELARNGLTACVQEALAELGYFQPTTSVRLVADRVRQLADLKVEITDEGVKGTIAEIEVTGLHVNSRAQLLEYLNLKPGVELHPNMVATTSNRLWQSARFFRHDVILVPLPQVGRFKLTLDFDEVREAPPLNQELSHKEIALLRFRDWLAGWEKRPEDFVFSLGVANSPSSYRAEMALSSSGFALAIRDNSSNPPPKLHYAVVASDKLSGFYSVWRRSKFAIQRATDHGQVSLRLRPPSPRSYGPGAINLSMGLGVPASEPPFRLNFELEPAVFLSMAHENSTTFKEGVLTWSNTWDDVWQEIRVDAATGRLLQFAQGSSGTNAMIVRGHSEEGAFARLLKEIAVATADHPNQYFTNRGFVSWLSFITTDLVESPLIERALDWFDQDLTAKDGPGTTRMSHQIKTALALTRAVVPQRSLDRFFEPLNRLFKAKADDPDEDPFSIPIDVSLAKGAADPSMAMIAAFALASVDHLLPRDSWPWVLFRETAFTLSGQGRYAQTELEQLLKSEDLGPIGCLATAHLLGKGGNPRLARTFAERGLSRLTPAQFRKDYGTLTQTKSIVGALADNAFVSVSELTAAQLAPLVTKLAPDETALIQQLTQHLRAANHGPASETAWPAFEQYWNKALGRHIETMLNRFLPQVQRLTNSQELYERGLALISPESAFQDFDEAAQCFGKAAEQNHAAAQLQFGALAQFGKGVPQDFAEAMRWYREAAKQKEPHAACRIAGLYHDGKGVSQDLEEAIKWYRLDAESNCPGAQFNLGHILESQLHTDESLKWYRRAAENGATPAQARLGDMLSDGFSATPDYVEACQWLILAADGGDKLSEIRLRRVKAKLSVEQVKEATKRGEAVTERLEAQKKGAEGVRRSSAGMPPGT